MNNWGDVGGYPTSKTPGGYNYATGEPLRADFLGGGGGGYVPNVSAGYGYQTGAPLDGETRAGFLAELGSSVDAPYIPRARGWWINGVHIVGLS